MHGNVKQVTVGESGRPGPDQGPLEKLYINDSLSERRWYQEDSDEEEMDEKELAEWIGTAGSCCLGLEAVRKLKVAELKEELRKVGMSQKGLKCQLLARLEQCCAERSDADEFLGCYPLHEGPCSANFTHNGLLGKDGGQKLACGPKGRP